MVRKEHLTMAADYINVPETSTRRSTTAASGANYYKGIAVAFGLLCVLQVGLNVSLRIVGHYSGKTPDIKNECADVKIKLDSLDEYFQQGWLYIRPSVYYVSPVKKSWFDSRNFCVERGADLVVINSKEEQEFMNKFVKITWIGLSQRQDNGQWVWVDGTPLNISFWSLGEPNDVDGKENCTEINNRPVGKSWNDADCQIEKFWICEKSINFL
ncbi:CD209 antigen-like protein E isoform X1 [Synchiropus splendidus]|uniref:CD209 antigen-like protein E isoform X1 n=1 Tax=Synchiropus splendidus TaxID=270530 RepID=UPI00237DCF7F|nr:CD209 antigen-like protein E isoform X1 [Synchiropus splendidus]